ncbi:hypothetical protein SUGI_0074930 [Cryptomeria japonica]|nr:hypothetical protein SUGI_0074930 [Cryptomeria japonica]
MLLNRVVERRDDEKENATVIDDALALLSLLVCCTEELEEILSSEKTVTLALVDLVSVGSDRGKENAIAVLTAICHSGGEAMVTRLAESIIPLLQMVASTGSSRCKRKAA